MAYEIITIPCLSDNYAYLLHCSDTGATAVIDVPEAPPVLAALSERGWTLDQILITHHHYDHIDGVGAVVKATGAKVTGAAADAHRLPALDVAVAEGDTVKVGALAGTVIDVSGHTLGHIAYYFEPAKAVFTADSLMALGCGRVFEGTAEMMWGSLQKLAALPPDTLVCSGHEYTLGNARFALSVDGDNPALKARCKAVEEARAAGRPTVPSLLSEELDTNPFLRAHLSSLKAAVGMQGQPDADVFGEIRARKDSF